MEDMKRNLIIRNIQKQKVGREEREERKFVKT